MTSETMASSTLADYIIASLQGAGVCRLFGMPGGGSNADLIEAAGRAGLPFTLAHTETASAFMASAQAELTGKPGACMATLGPGAASAMNGVANALLDRIPLLVLTDCYGEQAAQVMQHQTLRHGEMFGPVTKWSARLRATGLEQTLQRALAEALGPPAGPVHLDCGPEVTDAPGAGELDSGPLQGFLDLPRENQSLTLPIERILRQARRPIFLAGLGARSSEVASTLRGLCERHGIPALVTYKAKGVVPDCHPWFGGVLTHGALERPMLERADLFIAVGLDPVELLPRPWTYPQPVISLSAWQLTQQQIPLAADLVGDVVSALNAIDACLPARTEWDGAWVERTVQSQRAVMRTGTAPGKLLPYQVIESVAEAYPRARVTVDAGAHMFPTLSLWPAREPCGLLISNGLGTMGFALPAAIGAALLDPTNPTVVFSGDGGLLMCIAELRTAARENVPLRVVVFVDSTLSLIRIKQTHRGYRADGVAIGDIEWSSLGAALGVPTWQVSDAQSLEKCLSDTIDYDGPVMIAARIDPEPYQAMMRALRG